MAVSYSDVIQPLTRASVVARLLELLQLAGFPVTSWGSTSIPRVLIEAFAQVVVDLSQTIVAIGRMATLLTAEGDGLTLHAADVYGETRKAALPTKGTRTLVESSGTPQSWAAGELVIVCSSDASLVYRNTGAVTLPANDSVAVEFAAEAPGSAYNVDGATVGSLTTPVPGVSISSTSGVGWITQTGTDEESDEALRQRCTLKWATLTTTGPAAAYESWALGSSSEITRVRVQEDPYAVPPDAEVTVIVGSPTGVPTAGALAAAVTAVEARRPLGTLVEVVAAQVVVVELRGTVYVRAAYRTAAEAQIQRDLAAYFGGLGIGGTVAIAQLIEIVMAVPGVTNFVPKGTGGSTLIPGTDDVVPAVDTVLTLDLSFTYSSV